MRIELLGPSGVGKTTTLKAAQELRATEPEWLGPRDANAFIAQLPSDFRKTTTRAAIDDPAKRSFIDHCTGLVESSTMLPSQKVSALSILQTSCYQDLALRDFAPDSPLVHDELLLHRAFSLLLYAKDFEHAATTYFELVPLPDAALIVRAEPDVIFSRVRGRVNLPNCYAGLDEEGLRRTIGKSVELCDIAAQVLRSRDLSVTVVDAGGTAESTAQQLHQAFIQPTDQGAPMTPPEDEKDIRDRLLDASRSFRKLDGRHELRTADVMYCAFHTPKFSVEPHEAQRDASKRIARFGLKPRHAKKKTVLDLGSNAGAMIFELSNFNIKSGLGIEFDNDKVELANEIAALSDLSNLRFEQGDIDKLDAAGLGTFDIVLALAIESHVLDPDKLYRLLGEVTGKILCFEGNGRADIDKVTANLLANGFKSVKYIGFCNDDVREQNNIRPMFLAKK